MALAVALVIFGLLLVLLYAVFRRAPRTWWIWGSIVSLSALALTSLIAPVFILPLFNDYRPLSVPELRDTILAMARANGVPADEVYEFDASRQSKRISANVSGVLGTMRISLNDNLLSRCTAQGDPFGDGPRNGALRAEPHLRGTLLFFGVLLLLGFAFLRWGYRAAQRR
jgi:STE24 endopeptidase